MKIVIAAIAAILSIGFTQEAVTEKRGSDPTALVQKLHGAWRGEGPCRGTLTFRPDGSYERKLHGPAGDNSAGVWELRWDALPPTLVLNCKTSDDAICIRKEEVKLIQLDDQGLAFKHAADQSTPMRFSRTKK